MKKLTVFLILFLVSLSLAVAPSYADDNESPSPRDFFDFDDEGNVETDSGKPERTFSIPPLKTGFVVDFKDIDIMPHLSIEFVDYQDLEMNVGVAQSRAFISIGYEIVPIIKLSPVIWFGANIKRKDIAFGVGINILDF